MLMMLISAAAAIASVANSTMSPCVGDVQTSLANTLASGEPAVVRVDQAAVPLIGEPGDRDARRQVRVDQHDQEHAGRARDPQPDAGRARGAEQARQQEEDRGGDADHRERDRERPVRPEGAPQRLDVPELVQVADVVCVGQRVLLVVGHPAHLLLVLDVRQDLVEDREDPVHLGSRDRERRLDLQDVAEPGVPGRAEDDAEIHRAPVHLQRLFGGRLLGLLIAHELDADEQARPARASPFRRLRNS
jgi:hypothetical protein